MLPVFSGSAVSFPSFVVYTIALISSYMFHTSLMETSDDIDLVTDTCWRSRVVKIGVGIISLYSMSVLLVD